MATFHIWSCFLWQLAHCDESLKVMPHGVIPLYAFGLDDAVCFQCLRQWSCTMFSLLGQWAFWPWLPTDSGKHSFLPDVIWGWVLVLVALISVLWISWKCLLCTYASRVCPDDSCWNEVVYKFQSLLQERIGWGHTWDYLQEWEEFCINMSWKCGYIKKHACMVFPWSCKYSASGHHDPVFLVFLLYLEVQQNLRM